MKRETEPEETPSIDTKPDVNPSTPPRKKAKNASITSTTSSPARHGLSPELRQAIYLDIFTAGIAALGGSGALATKFGLDKSQICHALQAGRKGNLRDKLWTAAGQ